MSILNVNTIQPVGSGQTITVSATNISAPSTVVTASSFVGNVTATTISGVSTAGITTAYIGSINDGPLAGARNRIINGDMRIDQRNNGASVTPTSDVYTLDRWIAVRSQASKFSIQQNAGSVTPPVGFTSYLGATSLSAYSVLSSDYFTIDQSIEGFNISDLAWGTASAKTVTLSFWVRSSLTGTFGGVFNNSGATRSYPFTYTISSANTWEFKSITVPGDTSGTWLTNNGIGIEIRFGLGVGSSQSGTAGSWSGSTFLGATGATSVVGTNGATWYITGVQLEPGTVATPFERRSFGQELALAQRYYYRVDAVDFGGGGPIFGSGSNNNTTTSMIWTPFAVPMRTSPSSIDTTGTASNYSVIHANTSTTCSSVPVIDDRNRYGCRINLTVASGLTAGQGSFGRLATTGTSYIGFNAEL